MTLLLALSIVRGAPWLPTRHKQVEQALDLLDLQPGQTMIDLGSGDGKVLAAAARRGWRGIGYEINPILYLWGLVRTWPYRDLVSLKLQSYWSVKLPEADGIYVFLIDHYMKQLDKKLTQDIDISTSVVSYVFPIPGREADHEQQGLYLYTYGES